jgi:hypothetical protein
MMARLNSKYAPALVVTALLAVGATAAVVVAQDKTGSGQNLLKIDLNDSELVAFRASPGARSAADDPRLAGLQIPVLAFDGVPQIVKNVAGPEAKPTKPRSVITDAKQPFWYHLVDTYEGISIAVDADRRINQEVGKSFQIGPPKLGAEAALGTKAKPKISILDNHSEEGMEGMLIEYTVQKYPDIPYTVTIECSGKAKAQCKDVGVIANDQALLKLIAAPGK